MSVSKPALSAVPIRAGWRGTVDTLRTERSHRILSGSLIMLLGSTLVSVFNFAYNVAVARMLGPSEFGHTSVAVTLLMLSSAISLSFQLVCAKFVARNETAGGKAEVYRTLRRRSWLVGAMLGAALVVFSPAMSSYLRLPTPWIVILLAMGLTFYVPLGVKRGGLQGTCAFTQLSGNFLLEVIVKFVAALVFVEIGWGVLGAVGAIALSVVVAFLVPLRNPVLEVEAEKGLPASFREGLQAIVFFVGQVLINNIDILLVKHFFHSQDAGLYAAVALVGRVLHFASWSVASAMFPISAGAKPREENANVIVVPLLFVLFISIGFILLLGFMPGLVLKTVFGVDFAQAQSLLGLQAAAAGAYALSVVLLTYEMSRRIANTAWLQLVFSGLVVVGVYGWHDTLREVIVVQLVLRVFLLIAVSVPFFRPQKQVRLQEAV